MSRPPPQPVFVHRGFIGGVISCAVVHTANGDGILVGTGGGRCEMYDADIHMLIRTVYVDEQGRSITSVGTIDDLVWIHVRNHGVIVLTANDSILTTLHLTHCGFCMASVLGSWLVYPDTTNGKHYLKFWSRNSKYREPVALKDIPLVLMSADDAMFVGDEAGALSRITSEGIIQEQVRLFREPIFCMASSSSALACGSSKPPILMLAMDNISGDRVKVYYPQTSQGVGSMAFTTSGKTLIAGFWDGSIRAFSTRNLTVLLYLDFHKETIPQLLFQKVNEGNMLIVASKDESLSLWKL